MAHVHGEKMVEVAKKVAEEASCPFHAAGEVMGPAMAGMEGMKGMSGMMMGPGMGAAMTPRAMAAGVATGAAATAASASGHSLLRRVATHPLVLFGVGLAIGYLIHKYREEVIHQAEQATD